MTTVFADLSVSLEGFVAGPDPSLQDPLDVGALTLARAAAGEKDVQIHGGGEAVQQAIAAGALDELNLHVAPVLLGSGFPLLGGTAGRFERVRVIESPSGVTHIRYKRV
jgi:dihydrofolate reductase